MDALRVEGGQQLDHVVDGELGSTLVSQAYPLDDLDQLVFHPVEQLFAVHATATSGFASGW